MKQENSEQLIELARNKLLEVTSYLKGKGIRLRIEGGDIDIARVGHWVWAEGDTLKDLPEVRGSLKGMGFKFSPCRKAWGWSPYKYRGKRSPLALGQLAVKHGYELAK